MLLGINHLSFERTQTGNIRHVRLIIQPIADKNGIKSAGFHFTSFDVFHSNRPSTGGVVIGRRLYEGDVTVVRDVFLQVKIRSVRMKIRQYATVQIRNRMKRKDGKALRWLVSPTASVMIIMDNMHSYHYTTMHSIIAFHFCSIFFRGAHKKKNQNRRLICNAETSSNTMQACRNRAFISTVRIVFLIALYHGGVFKYLKYSANIIVPYKHTINYTVA